MLARDQQMTENYMQAMRPSIALDRSQTLTSSQNKQNVGGLLRCFSADGDGVFVEAIVFRQRVYQIQNGINSF